MPEEMEGVLIRSLKTSNYSGFVSCLKWKFGVAHQNLYVLDSMIHISILGSKKETWRVMALGFSKFILLMTGPGIQMENGKARSPPYPPLLGKGQRVTQEA